MRILFSALLSCLGLLVLAWPVSAASDVDARGQRWSILLGELATQSYLAGIEPDRYERRGMDPTRPELSPLRIGKTMRTIDRVWDYDFPRLEVVEDHLRRVDRRRALEGWFARLTVTANSETERHLCVARFLSRALFHNLIQPVYADRTGVFDPLVLLELGEARCGQVARVGIDLFTAAGYRARLVQVAHHQLAEVYYDGGWHYLDPDTHSNGRSLIDPDGTIPSIAALSRDPQRIDKMIPYWEPDFRNRIHIRSNHYTSYFLFNLRRYTTPPQVVYKVATWDEQQASRYFGWTTHNDIVFDEDRIMSETPIFYLPGSPLWRDVEERSLGGGRRSITLRWRASRDRDHDLLGYRVFLSRHSRGWCYNDALLTEAVLPYVDRERRWNADMYECRFQRPPSDLALIETGLLSCTFELDDATTCYATVMPFDAHGEAVGRELYPQSEELRIPARDGSSEPPRPIVPLAERRAEIEKR